MVALSFWSVSPDKVRDSEKVGNRPNVAIGIRSVEAFVFYHLLFCDEKGNFIV